MPPYADLKKTEKVSKPAKGTLQWLITDQPTTFQDDAETLQTNDFVEWRDSNISCILLVTAAPGQGKSVLSNFVVDHLEEQQIPEQKKVIYYFCNIKNDEISRTASSVVRALIVQLCEDQRLFRKLPNRFQNKDEKKDFFSASLAELWAVFSDLIKTDIYTCIYCIIDGLDVYATQMDDLLGYFNGLFRQRGTPHLKLFCTSRPESLVMEIGLSPMKVLRATEGDLSAFIDARLESFPTRFTDPKKNTIRETVMNRVGRTFLWISIVLRELRSLQDTSVSAIEGKIEAVPKDITDLYTHLIEKIFMRGSVDVTILAWITYAKRPLSLHELEVAIAVGKKRERSATTWNDCEKGRFPLNNEWIRENLGTLVDVIDGTPFLIHQTLRDFLLDNSLWKMTELFSDFKRPELLLANVCMTYLAFNEFREVAVSLQELEVTRKENPLLSYAADFWHSHIQAAGEVREHVNKLQTILSDLNSEVWMKLTEEFRYGPRVEMRIPMSVWEVAICYDIGWLANLLLEDTPHDFREHCTNDYSIYSIEASRFSVSVCQELLNHMKMSATEEVVKAAAGNETHGKEVVTLLLKERGNEITITEEVVKAAAGNTGRGKEVMTLLLKERGKEITITEEVVKAAAGNPINGKEVMMLLLKERGKEITITEEVVKAAAGNRFIGEDVMMLLLKERGKEITITEEVVKAAAGNRFIGEDVMMLLLKERGKEITITEEVIKAAERNIVSGKLIAELLLKKRGEDLNITQAVR